MLNNSLFVIERAQPEEAAALLDYLKIIGGETDNLSFGAEGVPLSIEEEQAYLRAQCDSADNAQYFAKVNGEIIGTASLNRRSNRMSHRGVFGISLKKAWWGCGAASALMEAILAFAKENGFEQLNLEVRSSNARAIHLYCHLCALLPVGIKNALQDFRVLQGILLSIFYECLFKRSVLDSSLYILNRR